jgi:hypothetical protein
MEAVAYGRKKVRLAVKWDMTLQNSAFFIVFSCPTED